MSMLLTPEEVVEATGTKKRARQMGWFLERGIPAELGRDRNVKVLRQAYEAKMMPGTGRQKRKTEPRLDLLLKAS